MLQKRELCKCFGFRDQEYPNQNLNIDILNAEKKLRMITIRTNHLRNNRRAS